MSAARTPTLERYHEIVPVWSPRPPMTERLLAALAAVFSHPVNRFGRMELLWMACGMKPAGQYHSGELVSWASHWHLDEREAGRSPFGTFDPERLRAWKEQLEKRLDPATQAIVDELDEALVEAGWRTWREPQLHRRAPDGSLQTANTWSWCRICPGGVFDSVGCRSSNLVAVSAFDAHRLSTALRAQALAEGRGARRDATFAFGLALGYPIRSVAAYVQRDALNNERVDQRAAGRIDAAENERRRREADEAEYARILAWPDELYPYVYFIGAAEDIPLVAELRRRAEALFGGLPAGLDIRLPREDVESLRQLRAEMKQYDRTG